MSVEAPIFTIAPRLGISRIGALGWAWTKSHPAAIAGVLAGLAVVYWMAFAVLLRGLHFDEGVSVLAAQGILEHGYPKLPSGFVYHRAHLPNYMLAGSILVFGANHLAFMVPSLLFAVGSLALVYLMASRIIGLPWVGVGAVAILPMLQLFSWYSTGPRMYMALVFFTLLSAFFGWKGFIEGNQRYRRLALAAMTLGMLSHEAGAMATLAIAASTIAVLGTKRRLAREALRGIMSPDLVAFVPLMGAVAWFMYGYEPTPFPPIVIHDGTPPDRVGLNLNYIFWGMHLGHIEEAFPFALPFVVVGLLAFKLRNEAAPIAYLALIMCLAIAIVGLAVRDGGGPRLFLLATPFYALFSVLGAWVIGRIARSPRVSLAWFALALFIGGVGISTVYGTLQHNAPYHRGTSGIAYLADSLRQGLTPLGLAQRAFGLPCDNTRVCDSALRADYAALKQTIRADDVVVSTQAIETSVYLGRVDFYLRLREMASGQLVPFEEPSDEYVGIPFVGTVPQLASIVDGGQTVWVLVDGWGRISPEVEQVLLRDFERQAYQSLNIFVSHSQ